LHTRIPAICFPALKFNTYICKGAKKEGAFISN
jgi:hypothetical protein